MDGPHDIGGADGFGPVVPTPGYRPFSRDWERRIFGTALALVGQRVMTMDEIRYARERMAPAEYLGARYFEQWLASVETCLDEHGVLAMDTIDRLAEANASPPADAPHRPDLAETLLATMRSGIPSDTTPVPTAFEIDDTVRTVGHGTIGHTRLPRFARDRRATVVAVLDPRPLPDLAAHGGGHDRVAAYRIRFDGAELWGPRAEPNTTVDLDVWEPYLLAHHETTER